MSVILREKTNKSPLINMSIYTTFPLPPFKEITVIYSYDVINENFPSLGKSYVLKIKIDGVYVIKNSEVEYVSIQIYKNHTLKMRDAFWSC